MHHHHGGGFVAPFLLGAAVAVPFTMATMNSSNRYSRGVHVKNSVITSVRFSLQDSNGQDVPLNEDLNNKVIQWYKRQAEAILMKHGEMCIGGTCSLKVSSPGLGYVIVSVGMVDAEYDDNYVRGITNSIADPDYDGSFPLSTGDGKTYRVVGYLSD